MAQTGYTPILIYASGTASAVPSASNMTSSASGAELALNYVDGKLYYKNSGGTVTLLASAAGASGDVVGPASATDNALARFDTTTGKLIQNSVGILSDAGVLTGLTGLTSSGPITLSSLTSGRVTYAGASGLLQDSANLTFNGTTLTLTGLNNTGNTTLGDAAADTLTVNATITSNLIFTDNTYDIGASGATRPRSIYLAGNATLGGSNGVSLTANAAKFQSTYGGVTTTNLFTDSGGGVLSVDGANNISLRTGGVSGTSVLVVNGSSNYVGIGTSSPQELLHITATTPVFRMQGGSRTFQQYVGGTSFYVRDVTAGLNRTELDASGYFGINTSGSTLNQYLAIGGSGGTLAGTAAISLWDGNSGGSRRWAIANGASATGITQIGALTFNVGSGSFTADPLSAGTEVARFSSSANFSVGTTGAIGKIGSALSDATTTFSSLSYGMLGLQNTSSTANNYTWMTFNESNGNYVGAIGTQNIAHNPASGAVYGDLVFATKTNGAGGFPTEKVRILSTGAFLVNTTSVGNRNAKLVVNGEFSPGIVTSGSGGFDWQSTQESGSIANSGTYDYSLQSNTGCITGFGSIQVQDVATGTNCWGATFAIIARQSGTVTIISSGTLRGSGVSGITLSIVNIGSYASLRVTNASGGAVYSQVQLNIMTYGY